MKSLYYAFLLLFTCSCLAQTREIAITIDDLPLVASKMNTPGNKQRATERFERIVSTLKAYNVPATGFVIAGNIAEGQWEFLQQFRDAGLSIGNHTYSHRNLNHSNSEKYIADIAKADKILAPILSTPKYFRYPYLAEGNSQTKPLVLDFLTKNNYIVAPVTIDSKDYNFNEQLYRVPYRSREQYVQKIKKRYLDFIWKQTLRAENRTEADDERHILLIHANLLNSYLLGDILEMYKNNGYKFITLTEALKKPAPSIIFPIVNPDPVKQK